jgi:hypothetical protein
MLISKTNSCQKPPALFVMHSVDKLPELFNSCVAWVIMCLLHFSKLTVQVNYGNFMHGLMKENIQLNRKVLSELSMHEPYSFKALVDISRNAFPGNRPIPAKEGLASIL